MLVFDAAGLALFAVAGASKALAFHAGPVAATLLGMLTGIGGGMTRDVLVGQSNCSAHGIVVAVAALVGALAVVAGALLHLSASGLAITAWSSASDSVSWPCGEAGTFQIGALFNSK